MTTEIVIPAYKYNADHAGNWRDIEKLLAPLASDVVRAKIEAEIFNFNAFKASESRGNDRLKPLKAVLNAAQKLEQTMLPLEEWEQTKLRDGDTDYRPMPVALVHHIEKFLSIVPRDVGGPDRNFPLWHLVTQLADLYESLGHKHQASEGFVKLVDACLFVAGEDAYDKKTIQRIIHGHTRFRILTMPTSRT